MLLKPATSFTGRLCLPGDKSVSHRLVLISLLLNGSLRLRNLSDCADVATSLKIVETLGVKIDRSGDELLLHGFSGPQWSHGLQTIEGLEGLGGNHLEAQQNVAIELDCGNSGTTARLLAGILAARPGKYRLIGDASLSGRPMRRVVEPLASMSAEILCEYSETLPLIITGKKLLNPCSYTNHRGSAQIKSALLLAALRAAGETTIFEPIPSRDHTERLLAALGAPITFSPGTATLAGPVDLRGDHSFDIPGDISSAAFFAAAAAVFPGSCAEISNVLLNPHRTRYLEILKKMGAEVSITPTDNSYNSLLEPCGKVRIEGRTLSGITIDAAEIPALIDELPALAVVMAFAHGQSMVTGASELRHKETDRISNLIDQFKAAGIKCHELPDGFCIAGGSDVSVVTELNPSGDHRLAMAFAILACRSKNGLILTDPDCVKISFPDFFKHLKTCIQG